MNTKQKQTARGNTRRCLETLKGTLSFLSLFLAVMRLRFTQEGLILTDREQFKVHNTFRDYQARDIEPSSVIRERRSCEPSFYLSFRTDSLRFLSLHSPLAALLMAEVKVRYLNDLEPDPRFGSSFVVNS